MAITRKPKPQESDSATLPAVDVDALINKGGSVAATLHSANSASSATGTKEEQQHQQARATVAATLRIPAQIADQIDHLLEEKPMRVPRHQWILAAIVEKLERETRESKSDSGSGNVP